MTVSKPTGSGQASGRTSHLGLRLAVSLCAGATAILAVAGTWNLRLQQASLTEAMAESADHLVETMRSSTRDAMMRNDPDDLRRMIEAIGEQQGIERVRLLDKQGRIITSTDPTEVGTMVDPAAEQCFACHQRDQPLVRLDRGDRMRIFRRPGGDRVLGLIMPLRNEPRCATAACHAHPAPRQVLGVFDVQLSLSKADELLRTSQLQMAVALTATVLAVMALAWFLTWWLVIRPVHALTEAASVIAAGDLATEIPAGGPGEIGLMATAWRAMVAELGRARKELEAWGHVLEDRIAGKTRELELAHQQMIVIEKMASLGRLAAVVAHEINNPLAGIHTYARLLRRKLARIAEEAPTPEVAHQDTGEVQRALELIESESARCGDIVRNLLLFSRTPGARFAEVELEPLAERCAMLVRHQAELQAVELEVEFSPGLPAIMADASQIQQLILALLMNAIEASEPDGRVTLRLAPDPEEDGIIIEVSDLGKGIPAEHLDRIFEPFFTTKEDSAGAGLGLGLAVVYGIAVRHHGSVKAISEPGAGTCFQVRLPRAQPESDPHEDTAAMDGARESDL